MSIERRVGESMVIELMPNVSVDCADKAPSQSCRASSTAYTRLLSVSVPADPSCVSFARHAVKRVAQQLRMDKDAVNDVILAVGEACNNGILYGAPRTDRILSITCGVSGQCDSHAGALEIDVRNHGNSFAQDMDWSEHTMPVAELMAEHGRGLPLMRSAVDHVCIISDGGDTIVRLVKHLSN